MIKQSGISIGPCRVARYTVKIVNCLNCLKEDKYIMKNLPFFKS